MPSLLDLIAKRRAPKWDSSEHPRDARGRFIEVGDIITLPDGQRGTAVGTAGEGKIKIRVASSSAAVTVDASQLNSKESSLTGMRPASAEDRKRLKIPPAWTDVLVSDQEGAKILAVGRDQKGREQRRYSREHMDAQAVAKFERIRALNEKLPEVDAALERDAPGNDAAAVTVLIRRLGLRPGSREDTGAAEQAFGATTLQRRHVTLDGGVVRLSFTGKKGVQIDLETDDPAVASALRSRLMSRGRPEDSIFNTSDQRVRDYVSDVAPGFKPKDFRTHVGTAEALRAVAELEQPSSSDAKALASARRAVAQRVSAVLGNTPTVALQSYIDPTVFGRWELPLAKSAAHDQLIAEHLEVTFYFPPLEPGAPLSEDLDDDPDEVEKSTRAHWDPKKHPRGADGRFIRVGSLVRLLGIKGDFKVTGIGDDGTVSVRSSRGETTDVAPDQVRTSTPKPPAFTREAGARHAAQLAPARRKWLQRVARDVLVSAPDDDPEREYWEGVAGTEATPPPPPPRLPATGDVRTRPRGEVLRARLEHRTDPDSAERIRADGFDVERAGPGMLGTGVYLAQPGEHAAGGGVAVPVDITLEQAYPIRSAVDATNLYERYLSGLPPQDRDAEVVRYDKELSNRVTTGLRRDGYDGVVVYEGDTPIEVVAFDASSASPAVDAPVPTPTTAVDPPVPRRDPGGIVRYLRERDVPLGYLPRDGYRPLGEVLDEFNFDWSPPNEDWYSYSSEDLGEGGRAARELNDVALLEWVMYSGRTDVPRAELQRRYPQLNTSPYGPDALRWTSALTLRPNEIQARLDEAAQDDGTFGNSERIRLTADPYVPGTSARGLLRRERDEPGFNVEEYVRRETEHVRKLLDPATARVSVRVSQARLSGVLKDGRFRTQFETKKSTGYYDPAARAEVERRMFGLPDDLDPRRRPVYGYVTDDDEKIWREDGRNPLDQYGDVQVVLKPETRRRTTVTLKDSLDFQAHGLAYSAMPIDEADWRIAPLSPDSAAGRNDPTRAHPGKLSDSGGYLEAQIHDGVSLDDVELIRVATPPNDKLRKALDKSGVKWELRDQTLERATTKWTSGATLRRSEAASVRRRIEELRAGAEMADYEGRRFDSATRNFVPITVDEYIASQQLRIAKLEREATEQDRMAKQYADIYARGQLEPFRDVRAMSSNVLRDWYLELSFRHDTGDSVEHLLNEADQEASARGRRGFEAQGITYPADSQAAKMKWRQAVNEVAERLRAQGVILSEAQVSRYYRG